jgi:hemoglobin/transferrin/lactoferrin receptor protein
MIENENPLFLSTKLAACLALAFAGSAALAQAVERPGETVLPAVKAKAEADKPAQEAGSKKTLSAEELEQASSMQDVVRNQPLVSAPGVGVGATRNKSSFDRAGTTGYNIRGVEGNRVGLDVDGVELPSASTRPYVSRAGLNSFGIGRDYIDPEMYSTVEIDSGTTGARRSAGGIGGSVGFRSKSPEHFLSATKSSYVGAKLAYDSVDNSWNESVTAAARSGQLDGLIAFSHRKGKEAENNSETVPSNPEDWSSNALLLKGGMNIGTAHRLVLSADLYHRDNKSSFSTWNTAGTAVASNSVQDGTTKRGTLQLSHLWTPTDAWVDSVDTKLYVQDARTEDLTDTTTLSTATTTNSLSGTRSKSVGLSSAADKRIGAHRLSFGVNASSEDTERPWSVSGTVKPQPDSTNRRIGAFFQDEISVRLGEHRLAVTPALRVDHAELKARNLADFASTGLGSAGAEQLYGTPSKNTIVSPSLGVVYELSKDFSAYASYRRSGRVPTAGELYGSWNNGTSTASYHLVGNSALKPETSSTFDLGLKGSPTRGVNLSASVFHSEYKNFIAYTRYTSTGNPDLFVNLPSNITILYQAENRDQATIYGLEAAARIDHGVWTPALQGVYSTWALGVSRGTSKSYYDGDKDVDLDSVQPDKAVIGLGYAAPQKAWGLGVTGTFAKGKQAKATNREAYNNSGTALTDSTTELMRVPGYAVFDLTAHWQISKTWRLNAAVRNLGDKRYWDYASVRSLQPSVVADQRDRELLSNPGRSVSLSLSAAF